MHALQGRTGVLRLRPSETGVVVISSPICYQALMILGMRRRNSRLLLHRDGVEASETDGRGTFCWDDLTGVRPARAPTRSRCWVTAA